MVESNKSLSISNTRTKVSGTIEDDID